MDVALFKEAFEDLKFDFLLSHAAYCRDVLKLKKGQKAVISNGRVSHSHVIADKYSADEKNTSAHQAKASVAHEPVIFHFLFPDNWSAGGGRGI